MICAVLLVREISQLSDQLYQAYHQDIDLVEIRLDAMQKIDLIELRSVLETVKIPYILSLRSEWLNQEITPPEEGRIPFLKSIIELKPDYLSFEYPLDMPLIKYVTNGTTPVITLVDFEGMAKIAFNSVLPFMEKHPDYILKISATPNNINDLLTIWRISRTCIKKNIKHVILGMGRAGRFTRLLSNKLGNLWTYGRLDLIHEEPRLPGMVPIKYIRRAMTPDAVLFVGLCDTTSREIERLFFKLIDYTDKPFSYLNLNTPQIPDLNQMILWAKDRILGGLYIGMGWQEQVVNILEAKDHSVIYTGRCNMIKQTENGLKGYNTIVPALVKLIKPYAKSIKRVYIEGTDMNILSYLTALRDFEISEIIVRSQDYDIIDMLKRINPRVNDHSNAFYDTYDLYINCQVPSKGFENVLPTKTTIIESCKLVIDPLSKMNNTPVIKFAIKNNIDFIDGWDIFTNSLLMIVESWSDQIIPIEIIRNISEIESFDPVSLLC